MMDGFIKLVIGDLDEKRKYKAMMKKVANMPEAYNFAFHQIQKYMYCVGSCSNDSSIFYDLIELFETSIAENRSVVDVIGNDVSKFSDEFMEAYHIDNQEKREKLNRDIMTRFQKEVR